MDPCALIQRDIKKNESEDLPMSGIQIVVPLFGVSDDCQEKRTQQECERGIPGRYIPLTGKIK
jgi:hypothetical protein